MNEPQSEDIGLFRALVEGSRDFLFLTASTGCVRYISANIAAVLGRESEAYLGRGIESFVHEEDVERVQDAFSVARRHPALRVEARFRMRHEDGKFIWIEGVGAQQQTGPDAGAVLMSCRDISERVRFQEILRKSEQRFRAACEFGQNLVREWNPKNGTMVWYGDVDGRMGYPPSGFDRTYSAWERALHPDDHERVTARAWACAEGGSPFAEEYRIYRSDGSIRVWSDKGTRLHGGDDESRVVFATEDITERRRFEERLATEKALYLSLVENLPQSVFRKDRCGRFTFANRRFAESLDRPLTEIIGWTEFDLVPKEVAEKRRHMELRVMEQEVTMEGVEEVPQGAAERVVVQRIIAPLYGSRGEIIGVQGIILDVTPTAQLEEERREEQKRESLELLAGGMAHDFNNILMIIMGSASLLEGCQELDDEAAQHTERILQTTQRAGELTEQLLMLSRRSPAEFELIHLETFVQQMRAKLGEILGPKVRLKLQVSPELHVEGDRSLLEQAVVNLVANAGDAMPNGGELSILGTEATIQANDHRHSPPQRPGAFACLSFKDTGPGIPAESLTKIFDPFFTTKPFGQGKGLGLATVHGVVTQHKGWIKAHSEAGKGAVFQLYLPRVNEPATEHLMRHTERSKDEQNGDGPKRILVAEDEDFVREFVVATLSDKGYQVEAAVNGTEALRMWRRASPKFDLIVTDIVMPGGLSGRELAEEIRRHEPDARIIFTSGYSADSIQGQEIKEGVNFLQKPYAGAKLANLVATALKGQSWNGHQ